MEDDIVDIGGDIEGLPRADASGRLPLYSCKHLEAIEAIVKDVTESTGIMFYFGDCTRENEKATKPYLLMNAVLGLMTL